MAMDETQVDPMDISFDDSNYPPIQKQKRNPNILWGGITNKTKNRKNEEETSVPLEEVMTPQQLEKEKQMESELNAMGDEVDVPEIETKVVDLPKQNENEKELIVEHKDEGDVEQEPIVEEGGTPTNEVVANEGEQAPIITDEMIDKVLGSGETPSQPQGEEFDKDDSVGTNQGEEKEEVVNEEEDKANEEKEKRKELMKEMRALAQDSLKGFKYSPGMEKWTPKQKQDAIKAFLNNKSKNEEPIEEEVVEEEPPKPKMTKEQAMAEARMLAQDDLIGVDIDPELWSQFSNKEKLDFIKMLQDKDKDLTTNVDEDVTNNYEAYKRYPTALRVAEDVLQGANNVANRMASASRENLAGGESIDDAVNRTKIPHYDYRSFFK